MASSHSVRIDTNLKRSSGDAGPILKGREKSMAPSIFSSTRKNRNGTIERVEETVEEQLDQLRTELASLTSLIQKSGSEKGRKLKAQNCSTSCGTDICAAPGS